MSQGVYAKEVILYESTEVDRERVEKIDRRETDNYMYREKIKR